MKSNLLPFYFGSLSDEERLQMEARLLADPEVLLDYLDLKREVEGASAVPQKPSPQLWHRLSRHLPESRRARYSLAIGLSVAAIAALFVLFLNQPAPRVDAPVSGSGTLFDSGHEQFGHANVL